MDFSQLISTQRLSDNQLLFDQDAMERSILRAEKRRVRRRAMWTTICEHVGVVSEYPKLFAFIFNRRRHR